MLTNIDALAEDYVNRGPLTYFIHDNGGRPFRLAVITRVGYYSIIIDSGIFILNHYDYDNANSKHYEFKADQLFLPGEQEFKSPDSITDGHCCLFKIKGKNRYVMVSRTIYSFVPYNSERITYFYSELRGSDVAYPVALTKTYAYLLHNYNVIERKYFSERVCWQDAYDDLWGRSKDKFYDIEGYEWKYEDYNFQIRVEWAKAYDYNEMYSKKRALVKYSKPLPHLIVINNDRNDHLLK